MPKYDKNGNVDYSYLSELPKQYNYDRRSNLDKIKDRLKGVGKLDAGNGISLDLLGMKLEYEDPNDTITLDLRNKMLKYKRTW